LAGLGLSHATWLSAQTLELGSYLGQVESGHGGLQASRLTMGAQQAKSDEGRLAFTPSVFANYTQSDDKSDSGNQATRSERVLTDVYSLGVKQMFRTGTSASLSYNMNKIKLEEVTPFLPMMPVESEWMTEKPTLELRQSLWRNFAARELKAAEEMNEARANATYFAERYRARATLLEAEMAYWKLSFAREVVKIQQDNLSRAKRLQDWSSSRVKRQLADKADNLQAEANAALRGLDLQQAKDDERAAARAFNTLRGLDSDVVKESIAEFRSELAYRLTPPRRTERRDDVAAAAEALRAAEAGATAVEQKYKPSLDVFGSYSWTAKKEEDVYGKSLDEEKPAIAAGVNFSMPLGPSLIRRTVEGYRLESASAKQALDRKSFEQEQEWRTLVAKLDDAKRRLQLASSIEVLQKAKLDHERDRQERGRSTFYQVLMFETEYAASRLGKLARLQETLAIAAQMKLFAAR
jgi:outer membrane protein TolC